MKRNIFIKNSIIGLGSMLAMPTVLSSCSNDDDTNMMVDPNACATSPLEIAGPFPIMTPAALVRQNIIGDRVGVPLLINIKVEDINNNCEPLVGALVDIWHCDAQGNYSEYAGQLDGDFTNSHFLRGRQSTNSNGIASFISIYPGWYPGRAPHIHLEIKRANGDSLLITQTAFPEDISNNVYATTSYNGSFDTSNLQDGEFRDSLNQNIATSVNGNTTDGYTLNETIKVNS